MRKASIPLLWLFCLLVIGGCAAPSAGPTGSAPSPTRAAQAGCPQAPAAKPGQAPAAPLTLYVRDPNGAALKALNPNDGTVRWQEVIDRSQGWITGVSVMQNIVYVLTSEGIVSALNASDGFARWCSSLSSAATPTNNPLWSHLAVDQQTVYAAGNSGNPPAALNASDGAQRWRAQPANNDVTALLAAPGFAYVTPGASSCGALSALNASDGHEAWCFQASSGLSGLPAMIDGVLYLSEAGPTGSAGVLDALNASDGTKLWQAQENLGDAGELQPAGADGVVYVAGSGGVSAFSASNGAKRWQVSQPAVEVGPAAANGLVYVGSLTETRAPIISALSASTGQQQWQTSLTKEQPTTQVAAGTRPFASETVGQAFNALSVVDGVVVVSYISTTPTTIASIAALNAETGQQDWSAEGIVLAAG